MLSQALVAYTIELDNEAELRMPHTTTTEGDPDAHGGMPWLVSYPLWANVMQYVDADGTTVAGVAARARTTRLQLGGLRRWGYVRMTDPRGEQVLKQPADDVLIRLTRHGRAGGDVWRAMPELVEERWRTRFGDATVDTLRSALSAIYEGLAIDPPAYLPLTYPTQSGKTETPVRTGRGGRARAAAKDDLSTLLSAILFAFTVDFETESKISLPISANTLRVLDGSGVRIRDLPARTGVSKEANAMCSGWLQRRDCAEEIPDPDASRGKVLRLTSKGRGAQTKYRRLLSETEETWKSTYGAAAVGNLRGSLEPLVGDGTLPASPLARGLGTHPENWRSRIRKPATLPHYPMVLHRGAYPDGS